MGGFLRFLAFFAVLLALLVLVGLPFVAGPLLTNVVRGMGLKSDNLAVTVAYFDPLLVLGRSRSVHVSADNVELSPATMGNLELTLGDVSLFDRSWRTVNGDLHDVAVTAGGETFDVESVNVSGPAETASVTVRLDADQTEELIRFAAQREGVQLQEVDFSSDGVRVRIQGVDAEARLDVRGGALVLLTSTGDGGIALIQPAPSDGWRLDEAWISDDGLNVRGVVDTTRMAAEVTG